MDCIKKAAEVLNDNTLLAKLSRLDIITKVTKYHHSCRRAYILRAKRVSESNNNDVSASKITDNSSFDSICEYVNKSVIADKRPELLTSLYSKYVSYCEDVDDEPFTTPQYLMNCLLKRFGNKLKIHSPKGKKSGVILYSAALTAEAIRGAYDFMSTEEGFLTRAALFLRKKLKGVGKVDVSEYPSAEEVAREDASSPKIVKTFFEVLYGGPNPEKYSVKVDRHAESTSQDVLFLVSGGHIKPEKHIPLGIAIKSISRSQKLIDILNRFGHCINYHCIEELETDIAPAIERRGEACSDGTVKSLPMGVAFNNYDELSNTLSVANTLHNTMGILYQNEPKGDLIPISSLETQSLAGTSRGSRKVKQEKIRN